MIIFQKYHCICYCYFATDFKFFFENVLVMFVLDLVVVIMSAIDSFIMFDKCLICLVFYHALLFYYLPIDDSLSVQECLYEAIAHSFQYFFCFYFAQ